MKSEKTIKTSIGRNITVTLEQATEWDMEDESFAYVCDTFDLYAHQLSTIEKVEKAMMDLLDEASCNDSQDSILEQNVYHHNYNG
jgi:hypothetical protein